MLYYSTEIFAAAGVKHGDIATVVVVGLTLVTFTLITVRYSKTTSLSLYMYFSTYVLLGVSD